MFNHTNRKENERGGEGERERERERKRKRKRERERESMGAIGRAREGGRRGKRKRVTRTRVGVHNACVFTYQTKCMMISITGKIRSNGDPMLSHKTLVD